MTPMKKVKERYPEAMLTPEYAGLYDIVVPSNRPSPGYKAHRALGAGTSPRLAWSDAAQRILRRRFKSNPEVSGK